MHVEGTGDKPFNPLAPKILFRFSSGCPPRCGFFTGCPLINFVLRRISPSASRLAIPKRFASSLFACLLTRGLDLLLFFFFPSSSFSSSHPGQINVCWSCSVHAQTFTHWTVYKPSKVKPRKAYMHSNTGAVPFLKFLFCCYCYLSFCQGFVQCGGTYHHYRLYAE